MVVVFVSDEEDQSVPETSFFIDFFRNIKGFRNVELLKIYAIVGDPRGGCSSSDGDASAGDRYIEVANACGGFFRSICEPNFGPIYEDIADDSLGLRRQFFLSRLADESTLVVTVDGVIQTKGSGEGQGDYWYSEEDNSINFNDGSVPGRGAEIVAEYDTLCLR